MGRVDNAYTELLSVLITFYVPYMEGIHMHTEYVRIPCISFGYREGMNRVMAMGDGGFVY